MTKYVRQMGKFSDWLSQELRKHGVTQSQLARGTGLTRQAISYYLSEKSKRPDDDSLKRIAKFLKIPVEQIYRGAGILPPETTKNELTERIVDEFNDLPHDEKENILEYIKMRKRFLDRSKNK